jgi:hypothetical protein
LNSALRNLAGSFQLPSRNEFWISFFCKSLYGFLILKVLMSWSTLVDIATYLPHQFSSWHTYILYAPLLLLQINIKAYLICFLSLLIISVLVQSNNISAILIFWFSVSLSRFMFPILNGSDLVLNLFLLIALFLPARPLLKPWGVVTQETISSIALLFARITLCLIYFLSGYDKLVSSAWRSGAAIHSIINLEHFFNPSFIFSGSKTLFMLIGWSVIIFEISFSLLIWFKKSRVLFLLTGVLFHLGIILLLGLPDFGLVMIICYLVFMPLKNASKGQ